MKKLLFTTVTWLLLSLVANAQTYEFHTLYSFPTTKSAPNSIGSPLIIDSAGNLYGTSIGNGTHRRGTVYQVSPGGTLSVLYNFTGAPDGAGPASSLFRDAAGNLYGTTQEGGRRAACGPSPQGCGTVYELTPAGEEKILYRFSGLSDGALPQMSVAVDSAGNIYGTTGNEIQPGGDGGNGDVYKIDTTGTFSVLHSFCATDPNCGDGQYPVSGPILDASGNLYGSTASGGLYDSGTIYQIDSAGVETVLYSFANEYESLLSGNLNRDAQGDFYGVADAYVFNTTDGGYVFKVTPSGTGTKPYSFCVTPPGCMAGDEPVGPIQIDNAGNLFGVVTQGGANGAGGVFEVTPSGTETIVYSFATSAPLGLTGLTMDSHGNLYGINSVGGKYNAGEIYVLKRQ